MNIWQSIIRVTFVIITLSSAMVSVAQDTPVDTATVEPSLIPSDTPMPTDVPTETPAPTDSTLPVSQPTDQATTEPITSGGILSAVSQTRITAFNTPIEIVLTATGGSAPYSFSEMTPLDSNGTLEGVIPNFTFTPNVNFSGLQRYTFKVTDQLGATATATIAIEVVSLLSTTPQHFFAPPNQPVTISLSVSGGLPDRTYTLTKAPTHGVLSGIPPEVSYTANNDASGGDSFEYTISDSSGDTALSTVILFADPVVTANNTTVYTALNTSIDLPISASNGAAPYTITVLDPMVLPESPYTFVPSTDFTGIYPVDYQVEDSLGFISYGRITVDVGAVDTSSLLTPPALLQISTAENGTDIVIGEDQAVQIPISQLSLRFDRSVVNPAGNDILVDVTNPQNYCLVASGEDQQIQTTSCYSLSGDDYFIPIDAVTYDDATFVATLAVNDGHPLPEVGFYRLLVVAQGIEGQDHRLLDGNGDGVEGGDFSRSFSTITQLTTDVNVTVLASSDQVTLNEPLTYTINITNEGTHTASDVVVTDLLPDAVSDVSLSDASCSQDGQIISCNLGDIEPSSTKVITITVKVTGASLSTLTNTVNVASAVTDTHPENNTNIQTVTDTNETSATNLVVNTTSMVDDGVCGATHCSLPEAINAANANADADTITFNLPGVGPYVLEALSPLPAITDSTVLDGTSQPGYTDKPVITIRGGAAASTGLLIVGDGNTIRGLSLLGFQEYALSINGGNNNTIVGNNLGTDGTSANGATYGILITDGSSNIIGGTTADDRNIISGNHYGISITGENSTGNLIQGSFIGTDSTGKVKLPNIEGLHLQANGTIIGGTADVTNGGNCAGACNLLSGNTYGIFIAEGYGQNTLIQGNYIGTDISGKLPLGNTDSGIYAASRSEISGLFIGGDTLSARNVISANGINGVYTAVTDAKAVSDLISIQGNFIGLDASGTAALGNGQYGLRLLTGDNRIVGNVISANQQSGLQIVGGTNAIYGNRLGTNAAGTTLLGQQQIGLNLMSVNSTIIGGTEAGTGNVIVGTTVTALAATGQSITLQGNYIGTDATATLALGNQGDGVVLTGNNLIIGGVNSGEGNTIAYNRGNGISLGSPNISGRIQGNSIFANGKLGIDLLTTGTSPINASVTQNDVGDVQLPQNFPVITTALTNTSTLISGTLNSKANKDYQIELFANDTCSTLNYGEGQKSLTRVTITTDNNGNGSFSVTTPTVIPVGKWITATATNDLNNTSEFSACQVVSSGLAANHYQETESKFTYSGTWNTFTGTGPDGGSSKYTNDPLARMSIPVADNIERVVIYYSRNTGYGSLDVYQTTGLTSTKIGSLSANGTLAWAQSYSVTLPAGTNRILELRNTSTSVIGVEALDLFASPTPLGTGTYQENASSIIYSGKWTNLSATGPLGGSQKYTNEPNGNIYFRVNNTVGRVTFYRMTASTYGSTQIYLDGGSTPFATMNNTSSTTVYAVPFTIIIPAGDHSLELRNVGSTYSSVDQITLQALPTAFGVGTYQETNTNLTYSGIWTPSSTSLALGGSRSYTSDPTASVTFSIDSSVGKVIIYRTTYTAGVYGSLQVYVDGAATPIATINNTSAALLFGQPYTFLVTPGNHSITLKNVGTTTSDLDQITLQAPPAVLGVGTYQETNTNLTYNGNWVANPNASALGGSRSYTNDAYGTVTFSVDNSVGRVTIYRSTYLTGVYGSFQVYVDGAATPIATINNTSATLLYGQPYTFLVTPGNHTITLKNVGTTYSDLDQITLQAPLTPWSVGNYQETNADLIYNGTWVANPNTSALGGSRKYTNDPYANVTFTIDSTVSRVTIYRSTYLTGVYGSFQVYVDGAATALTTINNTSAALMYGQPYTFTVTPGNHTITLKNVGTTYSDLDQITLQAPAAALGVGTYQETNANLTYGGSWTPNTNAAALGGSRIYTNDSTANVTFNIDSSVSRITVYRTTNTTGVYGSLQVYVDGAATALATINNTSAALMYAQPYTFTVTPGNHTITLKNVGTTISDLDQITLQAPPAVLGVGTYQETNANLTYGGSWTPNTNTLALGGSRIYTNDSTASVTFSVDSTVGQITVYRTTYTAGVYGSFQVYVDGAATALATINNTSATLLYGQPYTFLVTPGNHTITLKNVGTTISDLDQITLQGSPAVLGVGTYQETNAGLIYNGTWVANPNASALGGSRKYTNDPYANVTFTIDSTVSRVTIYRSTYLTGVYGSFQVYVDGAATALATINNTSAALMYGQPYTFTVTPGNHTITLKNVGTTYSDLDQITLQAPPAALGVGTYQETNANLTYGGSWTPNTNAAALGGSRIYTNDSTASVTFSVDSTVGQITVYRTTNTTGVYGSFQVYVDGAATALTTINNTSATLLYGQPYTFLVTPGNHTITLKNVGTTITDLDQITLQAPLTPWSVGTYQETNADLIYNGTWIANPNASALGGSRKYTNDPYANVTFTTDSSVSRVTIYRTTNTAGVYGSFQVYVDGAATALATINNTSAALLYGQPYTFLVTPGNHTITLKNVGTTYSDLDQITLQAPPAALGIGTYQETNANLTYGGSWTPNTNTLALGGSRIYTNDSTASVTFSVDSTVGQITVYRTTNTTGVYGSFQVYVDGAATALATINNTSAALLYGQPYTFLVTPGNHTITLKNVGTTISDLDQITLQGSPAVLGVGNYQETNASLIYNGTWVANPNASALGGSRKYTNDPYANVTFTIDSSVSRITVYRSTYLTGVYGSFQVYVDGAATALATINNTSAALMYGQPYTFLVTPGNHTITLKNVGATYSDLDQITLQGSPAVLGVGTYQETNANLTYGGSWTPNTNTLALGGSRIYTNDSTANVTFNVDSTVGQITVYRTTNTTGVYGSFQVYVDGAATALTTINNTSATLLYGQPYTFLVTPGNHTITLKNVGTSISDLDQITLQAPPAVLGVGTYQETNASLIYNGTWVANPNASALGGSRKYTNDPYANVTFTIDSTVSRVTIYRSTYLTGVYGSLQVYVDGAATALTTINNTSAALMYGQPYTFTVTPGNHTITLKNVGTTYSDLDQITLQGSPAVLGVGTYQETNANLTYGGNWTPNTNAAALGGSRIYTNDSTASLTFSVDSTVGQITIYRTTYTAGVYGSFQVYVDGAATALTTINNTSAALMYGQPYTFLVTPGNHTITLKNVGTTISDLDQITLQAPPAAWGLGTYQETNTNLIYNGTWVANPNTSALGGSRKYTNDPYANVTFTIDSTVGRVTIYRSTYLTGVYGSFQVYIDGAATPIATINNTSATLLYAQPYTFTVTPGKHTITLKNLGTTYSDLDQITLQAPA